jgi:hypothetical protein
MITVQPVGGLANRMRVIDSCYWIAKELEMPLLINWENNFELNCSFHKLFELPPEVEYVEKNISRSQVFLKKRVHALLRKVGVQMPPGFDYYVLQDEVDQIRAHGIDLETFKQKDKIFVSTTDHFYRSDRSFCFFQPVDYLQQKIDEHTKRFSDHTIGIHIRRTDNAMSRKFSPLSGFLEFMDKAIKEESETKFFLATDSPEVENQIQQQYGDRIITYEKVLDRNQQKGIQDALVDMYCLAACEKIIGSYFSSFSEVAAQINGIELNQIYHEKPPR